MRLRTPAYYKEQKIEIVTGVEVTAVDRAKKTVKCGRKAYGYDKLCLCTGSVPFVPPMQNVSGKRNVCGFLTAADAQTVHDLASANTRAVVIGAGLIGMKAAEGLSKNLQKRRCGGAVRSGAALYFRRKKRQAGAPPFRAPRSALPPGSNGDPGQVQRQDGAAGGTAKRQGIALRSAGGGGGRAPGHGTGRGSGSDSGAGIITDPAPCRPRTRIFTPQGIAPCLWICWTAVRKSWLCGQCSGARACRRQPNGRRRPDRRRYLCGECY